jgi:EGF domain-containing protein
MNTKFYSVLLFSCSLCLTVLLAACAGTSEDSGCTEGETIDCACAGGTTGVQSCTAEGIYDSCDCSGPGCTAGETQACTCTNGQTGAQSCDPNGTWLACQCDTGCTAGDIQTCICADNQTGNQVCDAQGNWLTCQCDSTCTPGETIICATWNGIDCYQTCEASGQYGDCDCSPVCLPGFQLEGNQCVDINECFEATDDCHENALCENTEGGFTCTCDEFYLGDGVSCDFDECAANQHNCDPNADCINGSTGFLCVCQEGFEGDGVTCTDIDECENPRACPDHSQCHNDVGTFWCECDPGYEWSVDSCININECERELDDCSEFARCDDTAGSFGCTCLEGYLGNGHSCRPDPDAYLADLTHRPVTIEIGNIGIFQVRYLSRVGIDVEVIEHPSTPGNSHKEPGLVSYPDITMGELVTSDQEDANMLAAWIDEGLASNPMGMRIELEGLDGEQLVLIMHDGIKPVAGDSTITVEGDNYVVASITLANYTAPPYGIVAYSYEEPVYPGCPQPGWRIEIEGVTNNSCWTLDGIIIPTLDSSESVFIESARNPNFLNDWMYVFMQNWIEDEYFERRAMALIEMDAWNDEVWRMNVFECWPAQFNYFNPTKDYGNSYLIDMLVVNDWNERG